jgi:Na+-transporting methylmalonyl-CoA/oxaloacetate decarboxylase beta subunit
MNRLFSAIILLSASASAFAARVPEPETLSLLAIGAVAFLVAGRKKKQ